MAHKTRWPLSLRILGLALVNLVLIAIILLTFAQWRFGLNLEAIALAPAHTSVSVMANEFAQDLARRDFASRSALLAEYSRRYGVDVLLVGPRGESLAGTPVNLPAELLRRLALPPARAQGRQSRPDRARRETWDHAPEAEPLATIPRPDKLVRGGSPAGDAVVPPAAPAPGWQAGGEFPPEQTSDRDGVGEPPPGRIRRLDGIGRGVLRPGDPGFVPLGGLNPAPFLAMTRSPWLYWVGVRMPVTGPGGEWGVPAIMLVRTNSLLGSRLFFEWRVLLFLAMALAGTALLCWWPFLHRVTRCITQMNRVTEQIAEGRFSGKLQIGRRDELGYLASQINLLALRLEAFVTHQKRFIGDVAHELCSPVARIQFAMGVLEQKVETESHLSVLREEIQEMSNLANELLMFSKAGMQPGAAPLNPVELAPVVRNAVAHQLPGTGTTQVSIPADITVLAYEPYLTRAVSNLLRNALRYAGEYGPIVVSAHRQADRISLMVSDAGPGVPEEALEAIFQPFYQRGSMRARDTGGAGLGLAIVKTCIEACLGTVTCRNHQFGGLEVTISLAAARNPT
jgi:two-component system sensor histidine kinase CpxA